MAIPVAFVFDSLFLGIAGLAITFIVRRTEWNKRSQGLPTPPGPRGWPIIGNLFTLPNEEQPWTVYRDWSRTYGDMMSLNVLGSRMVIVSSSDIAIELLEKRSSIYSDRAPWTMDELTGWSWNLALMPYGSEWRSIRRILHRYFNQLATSKHRDKQTKEVHAFLRRVLEHKGTLDEVLIRQTLATIILDIVYGMSLKSMDDPYIKLVTQSMDVLSKTKMLGAFWVDFIPFLKHLPPWAPGAFAIKYAAHWRPVVMQTVNKPFDEVLNGENQEDSITLDLITKLKSQGAIGTDAERHARYASGIAYAAGSDTTLSLLETFFCMMAALPEVQKKAQHELDDIVGRERLPSYEDRNSLPYIQAVILECVRWLPVIPLGSPYRVTQDDHYGGYFLPEGTEIIPVSTCLTAHPKDCPEPERFNPDRFLKNGEINKNVRNPEMAFGFGRRICPGRHLALETAFLVVSSVLHTFDVMPSVDDSGNALDPIPQATLGHISYVTHLLFTNGGLTQYPWDVCRFPDRLNCMLQPRSDATTNLILATQ
ncbi:CyP450 monooxygenase [Trametopsis cervina]|nr:CyP450 monooxygenase [Trametopsis cervina]